MTTPYALRGVRAGDADAVLEAFGSAPDMAPQGDVVDLASAQKYVQWLRGPSRRAFAVTHAASGSGDRMVGVVALTVDDLNRNGWVFYWVHAAHRGRGVTARATATVADWALRGPPDGGGFERLELGHRVNNPASGGVARAAGFVQEGHERGKFLLHNERIDVLTYGRLRDDPWPTTEQLPLRTDPGWASVCVT